MWGYPTAGGLFDECVSVWVIYWYLNETTMLVHELSPRSAVCNMSCVAKVHADAEEAGDSGSPGRISCLARKQT